jgi:hypothetical protein
MIRGMISSKNSASEVRMGHSLCDSQPILEYRSLQTARDEGRRRLLNSLGSASLPAVFVQICFLAGLILGTGKGESGWWLTLPIWIGGAWYTVARISQSEAARWAKYHLAMAATVTLLSGVTLITPGRAPSFVLGSGMAASHDPSAAQDMLRYGWRGRFTGQADRATVMVAGTALGWFLIVKLIARRRQRRSEAPS